MTESKGLLSSKSFWGVVLMVLAIFSERWFGFDLGEATQSFLSEQLVVIAGAALAIYGRVRAEKKIEGV